MKGVIILAEKMEPKKTDIESKLKIISQIMMIITPFSFAIRFALDYFFSINAERYYGIPAHYFVFYDFNDLLMRIILALLMMFFFFFPVAASNIILRLLSRIGFALFSIVYAIFYFLFTLSLYLNFVAENEVSMVIFFVVLIILSGLLGLSLLYLYIGWDVEKKDGTWNKIKRFFWNSNSTGVFFSLCLLVYQIGVLNTFIAPIRLSPEKKEKYEIVQISDSDQTLAVLSEKGDRLLVCNSQILGDELKLYTKSYFFVSRNDALFSYRKYKKVWVENEQ